MSGFGHSPQVTFSFYYQTSNIHWRPETYVLSCNDANNPPIHNEGNFKINNSKVYYHKKYGKCLLIEGTFEVTVYSKSGGSSDQILKIKDGKYKLLVKEWDAKENDFQWLWNH